MQGVLTGEKGCDIMFRFLNDTRKKSWKIEAGCTWKDDDAKNHTQVILYAMVLFRKKKI